MRGKFDTGAIDGTLFRTHSNECCEGCGFKSRCCPLTAAPARQQNESKLAPSMAALPLRHPYLSVYGQRRTCDFNQLFLMLTTSSVVEREIIYQYLSLTCKFKWITVVNQNGVCMATNIILVKSTKHIHHLAYDI